MHGLKDIKKKILVILLTVFALGAGFFWVQGQRQTYIGEIEAVLYRHPSQVVGTIMDCPITLGQSVKKGDLIALIDDSDARYAIEQTERSIKKAELAYGNTSVGEGGVADNNYRAARADYEVAAAAAAKAKTDYDKVESLYRQSAVSEDALNGARLTYQTASGTAEAARAKMQITVDKTAENAAGIELAILESSLAKQKEDLEKYKITAIRDGIVMSRNYNVGDMVSGGYNIADIAAQEEKYALFYIPKEQLGDITYEQEVSILAEGKSFQGMIKYIDVKSQYTPKDLQTAANKNQDSVKVKILLPENCSINPGQKVEIEL